MATKKLYSKKKVQLVILQRFYNMGAIKTFADIFDTVPFTTVAKKVKIQGVRFKKLIESPGEFSPDQVERMAAYLGIPVQDLIGSK